MENEYRPHTLKMSKMTEETPDVYTIEMDSKNEGRAGQFYMLSVPGVGEAPISVASGFGRNLIFTIRDVGSVTSKLKNLQFVGIRGPYGTGWPWKEYDEVIGVAGGIGIPPIRSLLEEMMDSGRQQDLEVMYGARTPSDLVYKKDFGDWTKSINLQITVDRANAEWNGNVGFVPALLRKAHLSRMAAVFVIGPPLMMINTVKEALKLGYREDRIFISLERRMECGIGVCGHCNIGEHYVCESGPIINYSRVRNDKELFL